MSENTTRALIESAVSTIIIYMKAEQKIVTASRNERDQIRARVLLLMDEFEPDLTSWEYVKDSTYYDEYLDSRREAGTIDTTDLTRYGLNRVQFLTDTAYHEHLLRVSKAAEDESATRLGGFKLCTSCGLLKQIGSFRKGAKCSSCRSRAYRANKLIEKGA